MSPIADEPQRPQHPQALKRSDVGLLLLAFIDAVSELFINRDYTHDGGCWCNRLLSPTILASNNRSRGRFTGTHAVLLHRCGVDLSLARVSVAKSLYHKLRLGVHPTECIREQILRSRAKNYDTFMTLAYFYGLELGKQNRRTAYQRAVLLRSENFGL